MLIKILKLYLRNFKDDDNILIVDAADDTTLEVLNVFKNLDTENLELHIITESGGVKKELRALVEEHGEIGNIELLLSELRKLGGS